MEIIHAAMVQILLALFTFTFAEIHLRKVSSHFSSRLKMSFNVSELTGITCLNVQTVVEKDISERRTKTRNKSLNSDELSDAVP